MARARVLSVNKQAVDEAIHLANEGKVTSKNAWDVRILEGLDSTIDVYMSQGDTADVYTQFTKAASLVESGAKVWAHRVESTFLMTARMQQKLMRSDFSDNDHDTMAHSAETIKSGAACCKTLLHSAIDKKAVPKQLPETFAQTNSEISLMNKFVQNSIISDGSQSSLNMHFSQTDPLFKAMATKLGGVSSQGATGHLLGKTRMGSHGNLLLGAEQVSEDAQRCFSWWNDTFGGERSNAFLSSKFSELSSLSTSAPPRQSAQPMFTSVQDDMVDDFDEHFDLSAPTVVQDDEITNNVQEESPLQKPLGQSAASALNNASMFYDPDWIPIVRETPHLSHSNSILDEVRKQSAILEASHSGLAAGPDEVSVKCGKKRVRFQPSNFTTGWINIDTDSFYQKKAVQAQGSITFCHVSAIGKESLSMESVANNTDIERYTTLGTFPAPATTHIKKPQIIDNYFQPFCTKEKHWNRLMQLKNIPLLRIEEASSGTQQSAAFHEHENLSTLESGPEHDEVFHLSEVPNGMEASLVVHDRTSFEDSGSQAINNHPVEGLVPEPISMISTLKIQNVTKPSVVDVGKLRKVMWRYIQMALEKHRTDETSLISECSSDVSTRKLTLSSIICAMIKNAEIYAISHDGTLSPAFFYFSLLFLANEKGLRLEQTDTLDDIILTGS